MFSLLSTNNYGTPKSNASHEFPPVIMSALCNFVFAFVRTAFVDWGLLMLVQHKMFSYSTAGSVHLFFAMGGLLGTTSSGAISDKYFGGNRLKVNQVFCISLALAVSLFWYAPDTYILNCILIFFIGVSVYGPYTLIGLYSREVCEERMMGTAESVVAVVGNVGSVCAGYPLSVIIQNYGWNHYLVTLFLLVACATVIQFFLPQKQKSRNNTS